MRTKIIGGLAASFMLVAAAAQAETVALKGTLNGASEVPPTTSAATGQLSASYDTASRQLTWEVTYAGLSGPATAAHFHGPAEPGKNASVLIPSPTASPIKGSATLTDAQATDVLAGRTYFNIHTAANPGGEIRGQVVK